MALKDTIARLSGGRNHGPNTLATTPWMWQDDEGRWVGRNGQVWLYYEFPTIPMSAETEDRGARLAAGFRIEAALTEIGDSSREGIVGRTGSDYREIHLLSLTWEQAGRPPDGTPEALARYQAQVLDFMVPRKAFVVGVRLRPSGGSGDKRAKGAKALVAGMASVVTAALGEDVPDLGRFDHDTQLMATILRRAGGYLPKPDTVRQMEAWYNLGRTPDAVVIEEKDHLRIDDVDRIELAAVARFHQMSAEAPDYQWLVAAEAHSDPARVTSVRGFLEPATAARNRARSSQRKIQAQIQEEMQTSDVDRPEYTDAYQQAARIEEFFINSSAPLVTQASIVMARRALASDESYIDMLRNNYRIEVRPLVLRQLPALDETLPCSSERVNPYLQDLSIGMLAYAGFHGFSAIGDERGAYVGVAQPNLTPSFCDLAGTASHNVAPSIGVLGDSGSGKALSLDTPIPTPSGRTTMGELSVGDEVFGRDGRPCRVVHLSPVQHPEMFDLHLSDGQVIRACADHQWVVASRQNRRLPKMAGHRAAIANHDAAHRLADRFDEAAAEFGPDDAFTAAELAEFVARRFPESPWRSRLDQVLAAEGCPSEIRSVPVVWTAKDRRSVRLVKTPGTVFGVAEVVRACGQRWAAQTAPAWRAQSLRRAAVCDQLVTTIDPAEQDNVTGIARRLLAAGVETRSAAKLFSRQVSVIAADAGIEGTPGLFDVEAPPRQGYTTEVNRVVWPARLALAHLAARLRRQHGIRPSDEVVERVLTTRDIIDEGVRTNGGEANFGIRLAAPLQLPDADLPLDPYVLGAWLGHGSRGHGQFTAGTALSCPDPDTGITDQQHLIGRLTDAGFTAYPLPSSPDKTVSVPGLRRTLHEVGVLRTKHIPTLFLRASYRQRLEVLRGLMDTDGTVDANGSCELSLCDERLAHDALELIRSLGIKVAMREGPATITEADPDRPGHTRRRVTGTRYRMTFTTGTQVFSLPRKARRIPESTRVTQEWLFITDIVPAPTEPARCIQVDSPDRTYLVGGFVPTHNTYLASLLAYQASLAGLPVIFINPKGHDTLAPLAELADGRVVSMSKMENSAGAFDPLRYMNPADPNSMTEAAQLLSRHILRVLRELPEADEIELSHGLLEGIRAGARCADQALEFVPLPGTRALIRKLAATSPLFALGFGSEPGPPLATDRRLTLIEFDQKLDLPNADVAGARLPRSQAEALAAINLVTRASVSMLARAGGGVLILDEAWTFLSNSDSLAFVHQLGRESRSLNVVPVFCTQRVADLLTHDMEGFLSRVFVMKLKDRVEAEAAFRLCGLEPTPERLHWLSQAGPQQGKDGEPARWAMTLHRDLQDRHAAIGIGPTPRHVHELITTNPTERERIRKARTRDLDIETRP
jgi:hypothetical protein